MKKCYPILCIYLLSCFVSCGKPTANTQESALEQNTQVIESEIAVQKESILDKRVQSDENGIVWKVPNTYIEQGVQQTLVGFGEHLLVYGTGLDEEDRLVSKLAVLSLETGEVLHEVNVINFEMPNVQVLEDMVVVSDFLDGKVKFFDSKLQEIKTYHTNLENSATYASPSGDKLYSIRQKDGIQVLDIKTNKKRTLLKNTTNLFVSNVSDEMVSVTYTDLNTQLDTYAVLDLAKGTVETVPFSGAVYDVEYQNNIWKVAMMWEEDYIIGTKEKQSKFVPNDEYAIVSMLNDNKLLTSSSGKNGTSYLKLYDVDGTFLSEVVLPSDCMYSFVDPVWSENDGGYFFIANHLGNDILLFWDLSKQIEGEDLHFEKYPENLKYGSEISETLYKKAEGISLKYGIELKIAEQTDTKFLDFSVRQELGEDEISLALDILEKVLASYPDNFMEQLLYGSQQEIEVHLVGALTKYSAEETQSGFTSFDAFVEQQGGKTVLVADITRDSVLEQTLYHEIAHLIDGKLAFDASLRENAIYSEEAWQKLNPKGFTYAESYHDIPMELYDDKYDAYFIDVYSKTFAKEDRARIMEYAMMERDNVFSANPKIKEKLEYWSACIRDAFDTTGWPEETKWEEK